MKNENKKIIWAVDPFSSDEDVLKSAAWCLRGIVKNGSKWVKPVYINSRSSLDLLSQEDPGYLGRIKNEGAERLEGTLRRVVIPGIQPFHVVSAKSASARDQGHALIAYAKKIGAGLIVVSSHGRKGLRRWLLGSFAETLSLYSDVPLMIVHPTWHRTLEFKTILFPTDFSQGSSEAFAKVLRFAAENKSKIVLFYKEGFAGYPVFDVPLSTYAYYDRIMKEQLEGAKQSAKQYVEIAKMRGIHMGIIFDRSKRTSVAQAILKCSKRLSSMIAMVSHSGAVSSVIIGSTARQVIRYSEQPVWVIHPDSEHQEKRTQITEEKIQQVQQ
ncbi:MAG: universal stress protein [Xanthomonadaceae bacterium]|nr:universal stress protein [Xanthomonadaceae bacterium]